jgi:hypothetical protein
MVSYLKKSKNLIPLFFFGGILFILLSNAMHESYPDEFDNILGGWYTLKGQIIYRDWFTHHNPMAYWISAFIELFSGQSFVKFRIVYTLFLTAYLGGIFIYFKRQFGEYIGNVMLAFILVIAVASTYFWGQMILADNLSAYLFTPVFALLMLTALYKKPFVRSDFILISLCSFVAIFSSLTYAFLLVAIYVFVVYLYLQQIQYRISKKIFLPISIFAIPYLILLVYFLVTGSLGDYIYQAIIFNGKYYVYNYPGHQEGIGFVNPIRYAIVIFYNFFNNYTVLLNQAIHFNFSFPLNITLALANLVTIVYLIVRRKFMLALFVFIYLAYSNVRSNPLDSKETDYQSAVYIVASFFNVVFILYEMYNFIAKKEFDARKVFIVPLSILLMIYAFFASTFLLRSYSQKMYNKFMGYAPLIYDQPKIAPFINDITKADETVWIGPFEFEELFYTNRNVPSNFHILIPGVGINNDTEKSMVEDFKEDPPVVMYYDRNFFILGRSPAMYAEQLNSFVDANYTNIADVQGRELQARVIHSNYNLQTNLYIRNDKLDTVIDMLLQKNYVTEKEKE